MLTTFAILIIVIVVVAVAAPKPKSNTPNAATPAASAQITPSPTPAATVALAPGDAKFVAAVRAALARSGASQSATDAQIAVVGDDLCKSRQAGASQATVINASSESYSKFSMTPGQLVRTAERDICPAELPTPPVVLLSMSGSGIQNSAPFTVNSGTLTVKYSYDCSGFGGSGNFIADIETGDQASLSSDNQTIANALGAGGTATTTVYPQNVGAQYHLAVNSECNWSVTISESGS